MPLFRLFRSRPLPSPPRRKLDVHSDQAVLRRDLSSLAALFGRVVCHARCLIPVAAQNVSTETSPAACLLARHVVSDTRHISVTGTR